MKPKSKYPEPKRIKVGRNKFVCDHDYKTPLVGFSWDSGNGQYYYTFFQSEKDFQLGKTTRKDYSFGVDYQEAVFRFKQWKQETQKFTLTVPTIEAELTQKTLSKPISPNDLEKISNLMKQLEKDGKDIRTRLLDLDTTIDLHVLLEFLQSLAPYVESSFTTDKQYALHLLKQLLQDERLRIEAIRLLKLDDLRPKEYKILPIESVAQFYKDNNTCSKKEKGQVQTAVKHFVEIVQKKNINDITEKDVELFRDIIKRSKKSDTYKEGRLNRLKTALNYYLENKPANSEKELVRNVLSLCKEKFKTSSPVPDDSPKSIDTETLKVIFKDAQNDSELYLMFLLMLNTAFYPVDTRQLKKSMIRTKDNITYIIHRRTKTKQTYIRVNCLWDITAKLLKEHCKTHPHSQFVFITEKGGGYAEGTLGNKFKTFFEGRKHTDGSPISAKHFRDTVASALAFDVHPNIIKITMGHSIKGSKDEFWKYVENRPEQQKPAIDVLYEKFKDAIESIC